MKALHEAMQRLVDDRILAGVSSAVLMRGEIADIHCAGSADRERGVALRADHLFRVFSNTKLVTSCAALLLLEEGRFKLDDPIGEYLPPLASLRVLRPGATSLEDSEPSNGPVTIRHLLSHTAGFGSGLLYPGTLIHEAYARAGVRDPDRTLEEMVQALGNLPLLFHPGSDWEYSMATEVIGRLVEVVSGDRLDTHFRRRIFEPLGMHDTAFVVPPERRQDLVACYAGASLDDPWKPGLTRVEDVPYAGAYLRPFARQSAGGGLVSSLPDMIALVRSMMPGGASLLQPATLSLLARNHLPPGVRVKFPGVAPTPGKAFGLAGAVTLQPSPEDPPQSLGEVEWGGIAGTHWWISPANGIAGIVMAQRQMAFWHPFALALKRCAYDGALQRAR